jgi:hypothetical protein
MKQPENSPAHLRALMIDCIQRARQLMLEIQNLRAPREESLNQRMERLSLRAVLLEDYVDLMNCYKENYKLLHAWDD